MKITKNIIFVLATIFVFGTLTFNTQAATKTTTKKTIKTTTVQAKNKTIKPVVAKKVPPVTKKAPPQPLPTKTPTTTTNTTSAYPWHNDVLATQFYIGEGGLSGTTAWDCHAVNHYGGIDSPFGRNGYLPSFTPKENPYYLALPYTDIGQVGTHKTEIPWYDAKLDTGGGYSFVKNRWVILKRGNNVCYGQYEDSLTPDILDASGKRIGYGLPNHFDYVFGSAAPTHPGIDVSPALSTCLGMFDATDKVYAHSDALVSWKFVEASEVPAGNWKNIITATPVSWENCP